VIEKALLEDRELLTEPEAKQVLAAYNIPVVIDANGVDGRTRRRR
jgi:hypothetical protein